MKNNAFTIVELMIVLIIMGILMGLTVGGAMKILQEAKKGQAEADIGALESAVSRYERDIGSYPPDSANGLWYYLEDDRSGDPTGWEGPYIDFDDGRTSDNNYEDPWDNNYQYDCTSVTRHNLDFVDIWTTVPSTGDTIGNW